MKIFFIFCLLVQFAATTVSASELPSSDARNLAHILGIGATITSVKQQVDASNNRQINEIMKQISRTFPKMTTAQLSIIRTQAEKFLKKVSAVTNGEDIESIYLQEISSSLSQDDMGKAISYFSSSAGRNAYLATKRAEQKMVNYIIKNQEKAMSEAIPTFLDEVKLIVQKR